MEMSIIGIVTAHGTGESGLTNGRANASARSPTARQRLASRRMSSRSTFLLRFFIVLSRNSHAPHWIFLAFLRVRSWMMIGIATAESAKSIAMFMNCMDYLPPLRLRDRYSTSALSNGILVFIGA